MKGHTKKSHNLLTWLKQLVRQNDLATQVLTPCVILLLVIVIIDAFSVLQSLNSHKKRQQDILKHRSVTAHSIFLGAQEKFGTISLAIRARQEALIQLESFDNYPAIRLLIDEIGSLYKSSLVVLFSQNKMIALSRAGDVDPDDKLPESIFEPDQLTAKVQLTTYPEDIFTGKKPANGEQKRVLSIANMVRMIDANGEEAIHAIAIQRLDKNKSLLKQIAYLIGSNVLLLDANKEIVLSSFEDENVMFKWLESEHLSVDGEIFQIRSEPLYGFNDQLIGHLSVAISETSLVKQKTQTLIYMLFPFFGLLIILVLFFMHIKYGVINRVKQVIQGLRQVAAGELQTRLDIPDSQTKKGVDEIGMMQHNFNLMTERLEEFYYKLDKKNIEVEEQASMLKQQATALEHANQELKKLSITDGLTGLNNRRRFDDVLAHEYERHKRSRKELAVIIIDIDYFKVFNDNYGHTAGDECLRHVGKAIEQAVHRKSDISARYGGEEFACILAETNLNGAVAVAEHIRSGIEELAIPHDCSNVAKVVTVSIGIASAFCSQVESDINLVILADEQLYKAKEAGRNRIFFGATEHTAI